MNKKLDARGITKEALKKSKVELLFKFITSFIVRAAVMIIPMLFGMAVDSISKSDYDNAYLMLFIMIGVIIVYRFVDWLSTYYWHKLYNKMYKVYNEYGLKSTYNNSLFSLSRISIGEYMNIMNNDIGVMCDFYCNLPVRLIKVAEFFIIFVYFFTINIFIGFAGVGVSLIALFIIMISSKKIEKVNSVRAQELDKKSGVLHEMLLCIKEIKAFNIFPAIKERSESSTDNYIEAILKQRTTEDAFKYIILGLIELFKLGLFIYGIYLISQGQMELGVLIVVYNYYGQLVDNFSEFTTINVNFRNLKVSENRFNKIIEYSRVDDDKKEESTEEFDGSIIFSNVLYGYKDNPTLDKVSFDINKNEITCISGKAGSGKTGIIDLLLRLNRQHEGDILIGGADVNSYSTDDYYNLVSSVNTESTFFNISIKDNLSVINNDFRRIVNICKELGIHEYITKLKSGYNTMLTSTGDNINPTVTNLLSIARVLLKEPKIMLFDDAFGSLDNATKGNVMEILEKMKKDHTIIIVSNEENILSKANKIIVLEQGHIDAIGKHQELMKNNEKYVDIIGK